MKPLTFTLKYSLKYKQQLWFCSDGEVAGSGQTKEAAKSAYDSWRGYHTLNRTPFSPIKDSDDTITT